MRLRSLFNQSNEAGFTIVAVLLAVTIATIAISWYMVEMSPSTATQAEQVTMIRGSILKNAVLRFRNDNGGVNTSNYPSNLNILVTTNNTACAADTNSSHTNTFMTLQGWCGPYVDIQFVNDPTSYMTDGWGTQFQYNSTTGVITSYGPNKTSGGGDDLTF